MTGPEHSERPQPSISVVIATYDRPEILGFAIRSVLAQDIADWELIVVGDHCAQATENAVQAFRDGRIRYVNLPQNHGDQSGPNNVGISRARGRYIALLNHDDFWFPDHLRTMRERLEASGADVVIARPANIPVRPQEQLAEWRTALTQGVGRRGRYDPATTVAPASTLFMKTTVAQAVGPWRTAAECYASSSQEWLFRIWKRGHDIRTTGHLSVIQLPSGSRMNSYVTADTAEHALFEPELQHPERLRALLRERWSPPPSRPLWRRLAKSAAVVLLRGAAHLGYQPYELIARFYLGYRRRGDFINRVRRNRGLPALHERSAGTLRQSQDGERQSTEQDCAPR